MSRRRRQAAPKRQQQALQKVKRPSRGNHLTLKKVLLILCKEFTTNVLAKASKSRPKVISKRRKKNKKPTMTQVPTMKRSWPKQSNQQKPFNADWPCPVVKQRKKRPSSISARTRATSRAKTPSTSIKCLIKIKLPHNLHQT